MPNKKNDDHILVGMLIIPTIYIALLFAPHLKNGLIASLPVLTEAMNHPFQITWCDASLKTIIVCLLIYAVCALIYLSNSKNYRRNEEYGSAKWGNPKQINAKYANKNYLENKILTQNIKMGLDGTVHRRNLNTVVIGGSGAGKSRFYAKPNIMQCSCSYIVLDPKGELLRDLGALLEKEGYVIKVIDLIDMEKSHGYNPFHYIKSDIDILKLITNLIQNTTNKDAQQGDQFWTEAEKLLLETIFLYLYHEAPKYEQNFEMVMEMIASIEVKEDNEDYVSVFDELFERLAMKDPNSIAYKMYDSFKKAAGKTIKSILISVGSRLASFHFSEVGKITHHDELELELIGERKTALFAIIPDNDTSFNFLVGMLYTQLFQILYYDAKDKGKLPIPVHFVMDEFANVALPNGFDNLLTTMRSRNIFVSIIIQNLSQLKKLYKDTWETIVGNCDQLYYLGGNEQSTHKYISEYIGKETIDTNTYGKTSGMHGNYSTNFQQTGRDLLTADEVRMLDNDYGLLFMRGERVIVDLKYDLLKHPKIKFTRDGKGKAYEHGVDKYSIKDWQNILVSDNEYELLSETDMDRYFKNLEEQKKLEELKNEANKKN